MITAAEKRGREGQRTWVHPVLDHQDDKDDICRRRRRNKVKAMSMLTDTCPLRESTRQQTHHRECSRPTVPEAGQSMQVGHLNDERKQIVNEGVEGLVHQGAPR